MSYKSSQRLVFRHRTASRGKQLIKFVQTYGERCAEAFLFQLHHLLDEAALRLQLRKSFVHLIDHEVRHFVKKRIGKLQRMPTLINGAAHDLAQHVIAAFIAGKNSVGN